MVVRDSTDESGIESENLLDDKNFIALNKDVATYILLSGDMSHANIVMTSNNIAGVCNWNDSPDPLESDHF